jgi:5-methylcytosine-specific restriction endonuclease McrA
MTIHPLAQLSDGELLARVLAAAISERAATAKLIALLAELDARRLYLGEGFSSLFTYCTQVLHLSEHAAYNRIELLERARHKMKRDVELLVATIRPTTDAPTVVRKLPTRLTRPTLSLAPDDAIKHDAAVSSSKAEPSSTRSEAEPARPRPVRAANSRSRHIPAEVKRTVWRRDEGRCRFVGSQGRCGETGLLEYHHVVPFADGGQTAVDNLELRCRAHNRYEADLWSGAAATPYVREDQLAW